MVNLFSLTGKQILITGASSGIGQQTAIACSRLGAQVFLSGRNEARLNEALSQLEGEGHQCIVGDLTDETTLTALLETIESLDGVVLCAGQGLTLPMQFATRDKFDAIFGVNLFAPFELLRMLYKKKRINKGGAVVTIASLAGTHVFSGANGVYGVSKAAIESAMKFCAKEFAPRKIRVNCISPGMVDTPLIRHGTVSDEQLEEDKKNYPLGRYGTPQDIAAGIIYLLSNASAWVTGQTLVIDGGLTLK